MYVRTYVTYVLTYIFCLCRIYVMTCVHRHALGVQVFGDIRTLSGGVWWDYVSNLPQKVDPIMLHIAGTSCKDASRLNMYRSSRLGVIDQGTHSTGSTFRGFADLVADHQSDVRLAILENVPTLAQFAPDTQRSNLDAVSDVMQGMGFKFISLSFSAADMGLPVDRQRLYGWSQSKRGRGRPENRRVRCGCH